jgi:hypothetical protein
VPCSKEDGREDIKVAWGRECAGHTKDENSRGCDK